MRLFFDMRPSLFTSLLDLQKPPHNPTVYQRSDPSKKFIGEKVREVYLLRHRMREQIDLRG